MPTRNTGASGSLKSDLGSVPVGFKASASSERNGGRLYSERSTKLSSALEGTPELKRVFENEDEADHIASAITSKLADKMNEYAKEFYEIPRSERKTTKEFDATVHIKSGDKVFEVTYHGPEVEFTPTSRNEVPNYDEPEKVDSIDLKNYATVREVRLGSRDSLTGYSYSKDSPLNGDGLAILKINR